MTRKIFHHWTAGLFYFEDSSKFIWPFTMYPRDSHIKLPNIQLLNKYQYSHYANLKGNHIVQVIANKYLAIIL